MRPVPVALVLGAALLVAACGEDGGGATQPTATSNAGAESAGPVDEAELERCLAKANLELKPGDEPYTDDRGRRKSRQGLDIAKTRYAGYVIWPSDHISDIYVSEDEQTATAAEREAGTFVRAFGLNSATYVQRHGNLVLVFDRPPPTGDEVQDVADCA